MRTLSIFVWGVVGGRVGTIYFRVSICLCCYLKSLFTYVYAYICVRVSKCLGYVMFVRSQFSSRFVC